MSTCYRRSACRSAAVILRAASVVIATGLAAFVARAENPILAIQPPLLATQTSTVFGRAIAANEHFVAVSSDEQLTTSTTPRGVVRVYDKPSGALLFSIKAAPEPYPSSGGWFGWRLAISGSKLAVLGEDYSHSRFVQIYDLASGTPTVPIQAISEPIPSSDTFAVSLAIEGDFVLIGQAGSDPIYQGSAPNGRVFVYNLASAQPTVPAFTLEYPDRANAGPDFGNVTNFFGTAIALSGNLAVVGCTKFSDGSEWSSGAAYIYDLTGATPTVPKLRIGNPVPRVGDRFGSSVAISGRTVAIGSSGRDTAASNTGAAYVFDLDSATPGAPIHTIFNPEPRAEGLFGLGMVLAGPRLVVSASTDGDGLVDSGCAYVFDLEGGVPSTPTHTLRNPTPAASDFFAGSLAVVGSSVVASAQGDDSAGYNVGSVYFYDLQGTTSETPARTITATVPVPGLSFGRAVALSGNRCAIGTSSSRGEIVLYDLAAASPELPQFSVGNPEPSVDGGFGGSLALGDRWLAVSAPGDDSGAPNAGVVFVFDLDSATPTQPQWKILNPNPRLNDSFGTVAISGNHLAVGVGNFDGSSTDEGVVYIYDLAGVTPGTPKLTIRNPTPAAYERFGAGVQINGTRIVVPIYLQDLAPDGPLLAYVFDLAGGSPAAPTYVLRDPALAKRFFQPAVAISDTEVAVARWGSISGGTPDPGIVKLFKLKGAMAGQAVFTFTDPDPLLTHDFASSIAISGRQLAVGARWQPGVGLTGRSGKIFVYDLLAATPTIPAATYPLEFDGHGWLGSGTLAFDRNRIIAGHPWQDGAVNHEGAAYVFAAPPTTADTIPPVITAPDLIVAEATGANGAPVDFIVTARDHADDQPTVDVAPQSGSLFPIGTTPVSAIAIDAAGNRSTTMFNVTVKDTTPPVASVASAFSLAADLAGTVTLGDQRARVTATDIVGVAEIIQSPSSNAVLSLGTHRVSFAVRDAVGNSTTVRSDVTVEFTGTGGVVSTIVIQTEQPAPVGRTFAGFGTPAISDISSIVSQATLQSGRKKLAAILSISPTGSAQLLASQGEPAVGAHTSNVTFDCFKDPLISPSGAIAFAGKMRGGGILPGKDQGIWTDAFAAKLELVLMEGSDVPGMPAGTKLKTVHSVSLRDGELLALITLSPAKNLVTSADDVVLLRMTSADTADVLLREGSEVSGIIGSKVKRLVALAPALGSPGHGRWHATDTALAKIELHDRRTVIVTIGFDGTTIPILSTADPAVPINADAKWSRFGIPVISSDGKHIAVVANLHPRFGGISSANDTAIALRSDGGAWTAVAREGGSSPTVEGGSASLFRDFFDPVVNNAGELAFLATLAKSNGVKADRTALVCGSPDHLWIAAASGASAADGSGNATTAKWSKFLSYALPDGTSAGVVFLAETRGGDTTPANKLGLWAVDRSGVTRRAIRCGEPIENGGPAVRKLQLLNAVKGAYGTARSYNASVSLAVLAGFDDGTEALVRVNLP